MYEIKKLSVLSVAKIQTFVVTAAYTIGALIVTTIGLLSSSYTRRNFFDFEIDDFTIFAVIMWLIITAAIGFIVGALTTLVYNLVAKWIGGIKMDITLEPDDNEQETPEKQYE